ncbi:MAG: hypothetical protein WC413_03470 [Candidatus Nanoarchaeia archaeon]
MNKKSQELPINTIVVVILFLIVLAIVIIFFGGNISKLILKLGNIVKDIIGTADTIPKN